MVTIACDAKGSAAVEPFITAAGQQHPSLLDEKLRVAELYDVRNVPSIFWIDESGRMVRANDPVYAQRRNRETGETTTNDEYLNAVRDWVANGSKSRFALSEAEVLKLMHTPDDAHVRAAANFRLGEYLFEKGDAEAAKKYFEEAKRLRPESWNYKRQAWALEDPMKAGGPEFWAAVDALGDGKYYPGAEDI